jgi:Carotenoid biosynthesis protein
MGITVLQAGFLVVLWLTSLNAWRQGHRWLATLVWGVVFGFLVEWYNVHAKAPAYYYKGCNAGWGSADHKTWCIDAVPIWVPIGWGCIVYLCAWTAQRLRIAPLAKPVAAAFLAVNLDLSLDPIATYLKLWTWGPRPPAAAVCVPGNPDYIYLFGVVPFDNFLGWYLIVSIYALVARFALRQLDRHVVGKTGVRNHWLDFVLPGGAALVAFGTYCGAKQLLTMSAGYRTDCGAIAGKAFIVVSLAAATITWVSTVRSRRDHTPNWVTLVIPAVVHVAVFAAALWSGFWTKEPAVLVAIPANLVLGLVLFAWPSLESLAPPGPPAHGASWATVGVAPRAPIRPSGPDPGYPEAEHSQRPDDAKAG